MRAGVTLEQRILDLEARNRKLTSDLSRVSRSRDRWREKAIAQRLLNERYRRTQRTRSAVRPHVTLEQWRQHDLIVARIRAIPDRA